jgi:hypothetical protein
MQVGGTVNGSLRALARDGAGSGPAWRGRRGGSADGTEPIDSSRLRPRPAACNGDPERGTLAYAGYETHCSRHRLLRLLWAALRSAASPSGDHTGVAAPPSRQRLPRRQRRRWRRELGRPCAVRFVPDRRQRVCWGAVVNVDFAANAAAAAAAAVAARAQHSSVVAASACSWRRDVARHAMPPWRCGAPLPALALRLVDTHPTRVRGIGRGGRRPLRRRWRLCRRVCGSRRQPPTAVARAVVHTAAASLVLLGCSLWRRRTVYSPALLP